MLGLSPAVRWAMRVAVSLAIVGYLLVHVDLGSIAGTLARVRPGLLAGALVLYLCGQGLSAYKWSLLGRSVGFERPLADYVRFYFFGMFFNLFGPSTIGGDVARGLYLAGGRQRALAFNSVVFDRASGLALLMALGAVGVLLFPQYDVPWPLATGMVGGGLAMLVGWWTCPRLVRLLPAGHRLRRTVEVDLAPFWRDRRLLVRVAAVSIVFHLTQVWVQWVIARAAGTTVPFSYCLVFHPVVSFIAALPVSVAGLGVREGGYVYFLRRLHVAPPTAVTIGLLWFAVSAMAALVGGALLLVSGDAPILRSAAPEAQTQGP